MWWKTNRHVHDRIDALQTRFVRLEDDLRKLRNNLADTSQETRRLDLDIVGLEDKVKTFTGRISVRKRKDREPEPEPEPEIDLDQAIRDGKVVSWPSR